MTLKCLHEQGKTEVGMRISPTNGCKDRFPKLTRAIILGIRTWSVIVCTRTGKNIRIYFRRKGVLGRIYTMDSFEVEEEPT